MRFVILPSRRVRSLSRNRSYEVPHLSRKIILANMKIWRSKMQPLSGNQRRGLLTSRMDMSLVLRVPREMHLCRSSSTVPRLPSFLEMLQKSTRLASFWQGAESLAWTSKSGLNVVCFPNVQSLNFHKCSEAMVLLPFSLPNVLRATAACTFWTAQLPKVLRQWGVLIIVLRNVLRATPACTFSATPLSKVLRCLSSNQTDPHPPL